MSALSLRNRIEYIVLGVVTTAITSRLAYYMFQTEGDAAGFAALIVGLVGIAIGRQLIFFPPEISVATWWYRNARKLDVTIHEGKWYYCSMCDISTWALYDRDGYLVGWQSENDYDAGLRFTPASSRHGTKRIHSLSWFSRWRSPKLPTGRVAEIIDTSNSVVGHTTYSER